ncbi:MAG: acetyl-CoA carboxylase biotin carboxyl carrier protein [Deltaproteobacteria bacterium]|nr:acetyl-CoA carboxylase biotin carboxyl carrier protein [Deltaproteobacteria bacterium]
MKIEEIAEIIAILKQTDVTEFEIEQDGTHIRLSRGPRAPIAGSHVVGPTLVHANLEPAITGSVNGQPIAIPASTPAVAETPSHLTKVESPIVGTFYRRPSPDSEPFVKEGQMVKKGDTLCIIEAMKLMNEIEATTSGRVEKVLLTDGQVVEYGEVLFLINPNA